MIARNIEVVIDELVLEGFFASESHVIANAIRAELERLYASGGLTDLQNAEISLPIRSSIRVGSSARPEAIGEQAGQAIHNSISTLLDGKAAQ